MYENTRQSPLAVLLVFLAGMLLMQCRPQHQLQLSHTDIPYPPTSVPDSKGIPKALQDAARSGELEKVKVLLSKAVKIHAVVRGNTVLRCAAWGGYSGVAEELLSHDANINAKNSDDDTPLHCAAWGGHLGVVKVLLNKGADIDARNNEDQTPLDLAILRGHSEVIQVLRQWHCHRCSR